MRRNHPQNRIGRVAVHYAMEEEAAGLARRLELGPPMPLHEGLPARLRSGRVGSIEVIQCTHGADPIHGVDRIGLETASLTAWVLMASHEVDLYVNAGTCGGFGARGAAIGSGYLASRFLYHDHRVPLPGFRELGEARIEATRRPVLEELLGLEAGPVSSGSSLDATEQELDFFEREGVVAKDMEATAIAAVAMDLRTPFMAIKTVTDLVDHPEPSHQQFLRNLESSCAVLNDRVEALVRYVGGGVTLGHLGDHPDPD